MITLTEAVREVAYPQKEAARLARLHWDQVAKPLGGLGILEEMVTRMAGAQGSEKVSAARKWIAVMCADNGIVAEGVTQTGSYVTAQVAAQMAEGASCVCLMARRAGAHVLPVNVGMNTDRPLPGLLHRPVAKGTADFLLGPAMSRAQAVQALETGLETAGILADKGCRLAGCGEMGIGNTTTSSALISVFLDREPEQVTGRGAGLSDQGYQRKVAVIREGIRRNRPDRRDGIDVLAKVGGFDLAALAGFYIGCARARIPVLLDGLITGAAALAAVRICPAVSGYLLASHCSAEPAAGLVLRELGLNAPIQAGLCLGEGTGAAAAFPLVDMALAVYYEMRTFEEIQVEAYRRQGV